MNHQEMAQTLQRHNKNATSHEQLAFMGRDVLSSVNIGLKDKLYFVTVYDLPLEALAFEAKEEESGKRHVIELDREDLKLVCGKKYKRLLQPGHRMKLAQKVAQWLTDEGPYPVQIISPNAKGTVFYQTIEDRMKIRIAEDKYKVEKEEAERRKREEQEELERIKREEAELKLRLERERKEREELRELVCKRRKKRRSESRQKLQRRNVLLRKRRQKRRLVWPSWSASGLRKQKRLEDERIAAEKARKAAEEAQRKLEEERRQQAELKRREEERLAKEAAEAKRRAEEEAARKERKVTGRGKKKGRDATKA